MNYDLIKVLLDSGSFIVALAAIIIAFFRTRQSKMNERFKAGSERMDRHEARLARIEQTVSALPSKDDIHKIELSMSQMAGALSRMEAVMEGNANIMTRLETIVTRHEDHLLKKGS